jgi:hypothetical protein
MPIILRPLLLITIAKRVLLSTISINAKMPRNIILFLKFNFIKQL